MSLLLLSLINSTFVKQIFIIGTVSDTRTFKNIDSNNVFLLEPVFSVMINKTSQMLVV